MRIQINDTQTVHTLSFFQLSFEGKKANLIMINDGNTYVLDQLV